MVSVGGRVHQPQSKSYIALQEYGLGVICAFSMMSQKTVLINFERQFEPEFV